MALLLGAFLLAPARGMGQNAPDARDAPQPTPQAAPKLKTPQDGQDKLAFPDETPAKPAVAKPNASGTQDFPFPEESPKAESASPNSAIPDSPRHGGSKPEAAADGGNPPTEPGAPAAPAGFSSSEALHDEGSSGAERLPDPARTRKDVSVAKFYWNVGNYEGAYLRYRDAVLYAPQDAEMWFDLAESERMLGKNVKARQDYEHALQLQPAGGHAKQIAHELQKLPPTDKVQPERPGPKLP